MTNRRTVVWFSAGAASAVAAKLTLRESPDAVVAYCETGAEHPDNERFIADCERWFGAALVRKAFPAEFERMAKLSRELDVRLCRIKDVRSFIDEIPVDHPTTDPIQPSCDFLCHIAEQDLETAA